MTVFFIFFEMQQRLHLIVGGYSHSQNASTEICVRLVGGGLAGITAASATYPLDLIRTRLAAQVIILCVHLML